MTNSGMHIPLGLMLICLGILKVSQESLDVIVSIEDGQIRGSLVMFGNHTIRQFLGIPFAAPPIGKLRFLAPKPVPPWSPETYVATSFKPACMQDANQENDVNELEPFEEIEYSEDCLYLNVFTPVGSATDLLPVLVFIHGGEYSYGSAHGYLGYPLATKGVVIVTIQYRLGPFGFLSTIDPSVGGNAGMMDQIMALKWVKNNIKSFNGNPDQVTLFGHNSGATSACLHMLSPLSQGLFQQVIAIGGVAGTPWAVKNWTMAAYYSGVLMRYVGCKDDKKGNILEELECMRRANTSQLLEFSKKVFYISDTLPWFPVIGGPGEDTRFLPRDLDTLASEPHYSRDINIMVGLSKNEGQYLFEREVKSQHESGDQVLEYLNKTVHDSVIKLFLSRRIKFNMDAIFSITKHKYTYWPRVRDEEMFRQQLIQLYTDYNFLAPMTRLLQERSQYAPSYMYLFDYHPDPIHPGAKQGAELKYIFGIPFLENDLKKPPKRPDKNIVEYSPNTKEGVINSGSENMPILPEERGIDFVPLDGSGEVSEPFSTTVKPVERVPTSTTKRTTVPRPTIGVTTAGKKIEINVTDSVSDSDSDNKTDARYRRRARDAKYNAAEKEMSLFMMELWTNFAKFGFPTLHEGDNTSWLPFTPHQWDYAWIKEPIIHMRRNYRHDKVALWNVYYPKLTIIPNDLPPDPLEFEFNIYQAVMWCLLVVVLSLLALIVYITRASLKRRKEPSRFADQSRYLTLSMQRMT